MTARRAIAYHREVAGVRSGARHWWLAGALSLIAALDAPRAAAAATALFPVGDGAVVQISARSANVTIRTWNRRSVQVDWPDDAAFASTRMTVQTPDRLFIRAVSDEERIAPGERVMVTLEPEDFPLPHVAQIQHDAVRISQRPQAGNTAKGVAPAGLTVMIPASTSLLSVHLTRGTVILHDYRGTTNAALRNGRIVFDGVSGDAFVQPLNGRFYARNSSFDYLRIRSNGADEVFDACRVKVIEATTLTGNILFDDGIFDPGLARFESERGSIALGVSGNAQLGAHAGDGRVLSALPPAADPPLIVPPQPGFDRTHIVGDGGPLVNALSANGSVFLYAGSLVDRAAGELGSAWRPMFDLLAQTRRMARRALGPARYPPP
jgi:hypothetical protein